MIQEIYDPSHSLVSEHADLIRNHELRSSTVSIVNRFTAQNRLLVSPGARTFLQIHTYFRFLRNPRSKPENLEFELNRFIPLIESDDKKSRDGRLPSIGVEIEVPIEQFPIEDSYQHIKLPLHKEFDYLAGDLTRFGVSIGIDGSAETKTEFRFPPTNESALQALMIEELIQMGFITPDPREKYVDRNGQVRNFIASMHINLGILKTIDGDSISESMHTLLMLFASAYVNPSRIQKGVYDESFRYRDGKLVQSIKQIGPYEVIRLETRIFRALSYQDLEPLLQQLQGLIRYLVYGRNTAQFDQDVRSLLKTYHVAVIDLSWGSKYQPPSFRFPNILREERDAFFTNARVNLVSEARSLIEKYTGLSERKERLLQKLRRSKHSAHHYS